MADILKIQFESSFINSNTLAFLIMGKKNSLTYVDPLHQCETNPVFGGVF